MDVDISRKCKYCMSDQTTISSNQKYLYCLDCKSSNFYRCLCGSVDFALLNPESSSIKCNSCGSLSWVPEHIMSDPYALEFVEKSRQESEKRNKNNKPKLQISLVNILLTCLLIFIYYKSK
jgi:hypothetical protein